MAGLISAPCTAELVLWLSSCDVFSFQREGNCRQKSEPALHKLRVKIKTRLAAETSGSHWAPLGQQPIARA